MGIVHMYICTYITFVWGILEYQKNELDKEVRVFVFVCACVCVVGGLSPPYIPALQKNKQTNKQCRDP